MDLLRVFVALERRLRHCLAVVSSNAQVFFDRR